MPQKASSALVLVTMAAALWGGSIALRNSGLDQRSSWPKSEQYSTPLSPQAARFVSMGYHRALADFLWARTLVYYGSGIMDENDFRYLTSFIDMILGLDPSFKRVYSWAASAVTFKKGTATQEEYASSVRYLERAMKQYPDDYDYFWRAGLRYWADMRSEDEAQNKEWRKHGADLIELAIHKPNAPPDLVTLAASLHTKLGRNEHAIGLLQQKIMTVSDMNARAKMLNRLEGLTTSEYKDEFLFAKEQFDTIRRETMQQVPADLFVILGPTPPKVIDFDALATERDLFGSQRQGELELFP